VCAPVRVRVRVCVTTISLMNSKRFIFVVDMTDVSCEVGTETLQIIMMNFELKLLERIDQLFLESEPTVFTSENTNLLSQFLTHIF
jgi:hypothetical protein